MSQRIPPLRVTAMASAANRPSGRSTPPRKATARALDVDAAEIDVDPTCRGIKRTELTPLEARSNEQPRKKPRKACATRQTVRLDSASTGSVYDRGRARLSGRQREPLDSGRPSADVAR